MKKCNFLMSLILLGLPSLANGQITIMEYNDSPRKPDVVPYDSLENMQKHKYGERFTYHHLIGQTIMFVGDKNDDSLAPSFRRGDYFTVDSILPDDVSRGRYDVLSLTNINTGDCAIEHHIGAGKDYNRRWVVLGYYMKMKELYQNKDFVYKGLPKGFHIYSRTSLYDMKSVQTNQTLADVPLNSVWRCVDVQIVPRKGKTEYEYLSQDYRCPVALVLENGELGKVYCYLEDEYGTNYDKERYLDAKKVGANKYVCGRFLGKDVYDRQIRKNKQQALRNKQLASRKRELEASREAERMRVATQRAEARRSSILSKYGEVNGRRILRGEVWIGMTAQMCRDALGAPRDVNRTRTALRVHEQWVYGSRYVYFDNGICTAIQD